MEAMEECEKGKKKKNRKVHVVVELIVWWK
jgi:hypothetical protein